MFLTEIIGKQEYMMFLELTVLVAYTFIFGQMGCIAFIHEEDVLQHSTFKCLVDLVN